MDTIMALLILVLSIFKYAFLIGGAILVYVGVGSHYVHDNLSAILHNTYEDTK
jgi:hypothetical protein